MPLYPSIVLTPLRSASYGFKVFDEVGQQLGTVNEVKIEGKSVKMVRKFGRTTIKPTISDQLLVITISDDILYIG